MGTAGGLPAGVASLTTGSLPMNLPSKPVGTHPAASLNSPEKMGTRWNASLPGSWAHQRVFSLGEQVREGGATEGKRCSARCAVTSLGFVFLRRPRRPGRRHAISFRALREGAGYQVRGRDDLGADWHLRQHPDPEPGAGGAQGGLELYPWEYSGTFEGHYSSLPGGANSRRASSKRRTSTGRSSR